MFSIFAAFASLAIGLLIGRVWNNVARSEGYDHGYSNALEGDESK